MIYYCIDNAYLHVMRICALYFYMLLSNSVFLRKKNHKYVKLVNISQKYLFKSNLRTKDKFIHLKFLVYNRKTEICKDNIYIILFSNYEFRLGFTLIMEQNF